MFLTKQAISSRYDRRVEWILSLVFTLIIVTASGHAYYKRMRFKDHIVSVTGTLTRKYWESGRHGGWRFEYSFTNPHPDWLYSLLP